MLAASPLYIALAALTLVALSVRVIRLRRTLKVSLGDGQQERLTRAIRAHGNFAEYISMGLLVLIAVEQVVSKAWIVHALGGALLLGRWLHAYGLDQEPRSYAGRVSGMALTFTSIGAGAAILLWAA